jgi:hypothetical protein
MTNVCEICGKEFAVTKQNRRKKVCSLACRTQKHRMATIRSNIKTALKELGLEAHGNQIASHYAHAREKHPYFCDWIKPDAADCDDVRRVTNGLAYTRKRVSDAIDCHNVGWDDLLDCEVWEVLDALINGDTTHAVEELYDCVAVLLRTIDVLEGRQKLGKHAAKKS